MKGQGILSLPDQRGLDGLIAKGCIRSAAENTLTETLFYGLTTFGFALADAAQSKFERVRVTDLRRQ